MGSIGMRWFICFQSPNRSVNLGVCQSHHDQSVGQSVTMSRVWFQKPVWAPGRPLRFEDGYGGFGGSNMV